MQLKYLILLGLIFTKTSFASWVSSYFQWTELALGNALIQNGYYVYAVPQSETLENLRLNYGSIPLKNIYASLSDQEVKKNNENLLNLIKLDVNFENNINEYIPMGDSLRYLNERQARVIYDAMNTAEVVRNQRKYGGRGVGFCFGRALVAHNHALIRNVHPASIRKIWVVGNMGFWGHHVSTIVKSVEGWVAIDNFTGIMSVEDWIARMKFENQGEKELMFFITRAGRFGHETNALYNTIDLFNVPSYKMSQFASEEAKEKLKAKDFYQGFFMDFYDHIDEESLMVSRFSESEAQEQREIERIEKLKAAEVLAANKAVKISDVSEYEISQETLYCYNTENQKLNCNYQLGSENNIFETSVSISGFAQYQIQNQKNETIYAKHIIHSELNETSFQIVVKADGSLTKRLVEMVKPKYANLRPYFKVIGIDNESSQEQLQAEIMQIKDVLATFNPDYQVKAENASPLTRILNN